LQPHRSRYGLNANPLDPEAFRQQATVVCDLYAQAGQLAEQGIHLVSTDEKTGMQALERLHPDIPMGPGRVQAREYEYKRHGTLCLTANLEIWCGCLIAPTVGPTRTEADLVAHVEQTVATDPSAGWVFLVDNLNTHQSEGLVLWVAQACGIAEDLGQKGKRGVLQSQASRAAFLSEPGPEAAPAIQLLFGGRPEKAHPGVHRLLQPDHGQAHRVALLPQATSGVAFHGIGSFASLY
jgi:hypothetical protein